MDTFVSSGSQQATFDQQLSALEYRAMFDAAPSDEERDLPRWGLALSGGGVRSATFALGVLQGLAKCELLPGFHYLSTVSGGGFIGSFVQGMLHRKGLHGTLDQLTSGIGVAAQPGAKQSGSMSEAVRYLRQHSNYLTPDNTALSNDRLSVATNYLSNLLLLQLLIAPVVLLVAIIISVLYQLGLKFWVNFPWMQELSAALCLFAGWRLFRSENASEHAIERRTGHRDGARSALLAVLILCVFALLVWPASGMPMRDTTPLLAGGAFSLCYLAWIRREGSVTERWPDAFGAVLGGLLAGGGIYLLDWFALAPPNPMLLWVLVIGTLLLYSVVFLAGSVAVGISVARPRERSFRTEDWARLSGVAVVMLVSVVAVPLIATFLPSLLDFAFGWTYQRLDFGSKEAARSWINPVYWGSILVATGLAGWGLGVAASTSTRARDASGRILGKARRFAVAVGPWALLVAGLLLYSWATQAILESVQTKPTSASVKDAEKRAVISDQCNGEYDVAIRCQSRRLRDMSNEARLTLLGGVGFGVILWMLLFGRLDKHEFSMSRFYRNRLVRCYLGSSRSGVSTSSFKSEDDIPLAQLLHPEAELSRRERPLYPLVCCAVNLTTNVRLDWQNRKAGSFVFSPLYCGHLTPPGRVSKLERQNADNIGDQLPSAVSGSGREDLNGSRLACDFTLGDAMTVSGAAVSPQMGEQSSGGLAFVLTLLNVRLGRWVTNYAAKRPDEWYDFIVDPAKRVLCELLCISKGGSDYVYVTDGGHFENLAVYELVRRQCRFIVCVDASADPDRSFSGLGNAIHKCRVDFGVEIDLDVSPLRPDPETGLSPSSAVLGKIVYADGDEGLILYMKPTLRGDEPPDISHYRIEHPEFPHEPTTDQFFDERQFEAYRHLGFVACERTFFEPMRVARKLRSGALGSIGLANRAAKERLLLELRHRFYEPSSAIALHFSTHGKVLDQLFKSLRSDIHLRSLDPFLFPGYPMSRAGLPAMPELGSSEFTACFYFSQEQIQLMESVYIDLNLEANHAHPDNRGWMNMFRQWSWAPVFRIAWALSSQTRGARFTRFCELHLGFTQVAECLAVRSSDLAMTIRLLIAELTTKALANPFELDMLRSSVLEREDALSWKAYQLVLDWDRVFREGRPAGLPAAQGVGLAVLADTPSPQTGETVQTLVFLRVQDHIRKLGLGTEFIRLMVGKKEPLDQVEIRHGSYRRLGVLSKVDAGKQTLRIKRMLQSVRA